MQIILVMSAVVATVAAPYALVMAIPRASHAVIAATAMAVPTGIALWKAHQSRAEFDVPLSGFDGLLLTAAIAGMALAAFVRVMQVMLGERAQSRQATLALNVLGVALVVMTLPWWGQISARLF